ncbi:MAG: type II secretion system F family protein [Gammaproteobacteria bacterium]|nr:type II secretion system F family protein [Gammaproteobacteria bacterium]
MSSALQHKIETYVWEGRDTQGKKLKGEISAVNPILAKAELRQRNIQPIRVKKKSRPLFGTRSRITSTDMTIFSRQLATMINAGVPIVQALDVISGSVEKPDFRKLVIELKNDVAAGSPLAQAMAKQPKRFDNLFRSLINVGEESGTLDTMLKRLAEYQERIQIINAKVRKAMVYPVAVLTIAFFLTLFMLVKVVPEFESLYQGFGSELPNLTQTVVSISQFTQDWWLLMTLTVVGSIFGFVYSYKNSRKTRLATIHFLMRMPVFSGIIQKSAIARFSRTLSTMFTAGVPLVNSLETVANAVDNEVYHDKIVEIRDQVSTGEQLHTSMRTNTALFPNMVIQMVAIGEESGSLDSMLSKVADFYEEEVNNTVDTLSTLMEPLIMVILGFVVGSLVLAMYMPMFQMGSVMQ